MKSFIEYAMLCEAIDRGGLPEIFLDLDGVVADFNKGAANLLDRPFGKGSKLSDADRKAIIASPSFWFDLPVLSDGKKVHKYAKKFRLNILSAAPIDNPSAIPQKTKWVKKNLGTISGSVHIVQRARKKEFARKKDGTPNLLIDDREQNIREWENAGGIGILYKNSKKTINKLKILGFK